MPSRLGEYLNYHEWSLKAGDVDPSYAMLKYVCDRFELNTEQRYWLAFLYALTYCGASVYYIYNEFPDYENLDSGRLNRWWYERDGRANTICQTDARWRRSRNQFVDAIESYRRWIGSGFKQETHFQQFRIGATSPEQNYDRIYASAKQNLFTFGQFTLFLYLEALHVITPEELCPTILDLNEAWSCRDGLYYAYGQDDWIQDKAGSRIPTIQLVETDRMWTDLRLSLKNRGIETSVWQIETVLCAFRKYQRTLSGQAGATGKRWVGYYLDRQADEIAKMEDHVRTGVAWRVLWEYRQETYHPHFLAEKYKGVSAKGITPHWREQAIQRTKVLIEG